VGRRDGIDIGGSIHLHATDADGEWTLRTDDGLLKVARGHAKGDVAVRGPASSLLLLLWRRVGATDYGLERFGADAVLDRWLRLGVP
jgi:MDMPI C-terminal domain